MAFLEGGCPKGEVEPPPCLSTNAFETDPGAPPENQAEAIAEAFRAAHTEPELSTKTGLRELEYRLVIKLGAMTMAADAALVKLL